MLVRFLEGHPPSRKNNASSRCKGFQENTQQAILGTRLFRQSTTLLLAMKLTINKTQYTQKLTTRAQQ